MNKKRFIQVLFSIVALGALIVCILLINGTFSKAKSDGSINVVLINAEEVQIDSAVIEYTTGQSFQEILEKKYQLTLTGGMLYKIGALEVIDKNAYFIAIYINDGVNGIKYDDWAMTGVEQMTFKDGDVFTFVLTIINNDW